MTRPVALLDANVLYPARLRDLLIRLDVAGLYQARWSEQILDECFMNVVEDRPDLSPTQLARTRRLMTAALPAAMVTGYENSIDDHDLPPTTAMSWQQPSRRRQACSSRTTSRTSPRPRSPGD